MTQFELGVAMSAEALAQLVDRYDGLGSGWVPLQQLAALLGWSPHQQRSQLSALQELLERRPWYLALAATSTGPLVDADDLLARARQLARGYRDGVV